MLRIRSIIQTAKAAHHQMPSTGSPWRSQAHGRRGLGRWLSRNGEWDRTVAREIPPGLLWVPCAENGCNGQPVGEDDRCIAHTDDQLAVTRSLDEVFRGEDVFFTRGVPITSSLLDDLIDAAKSGGTTSVFRGNVHFENASFTEQAWFGDVTFEQEVLFGKTKFLGNALFDRTHFKGKVSFGDVSCAGIMRFHDARFNGRLFVHDLRCSADLSLALSEFTAGVVMEVP